MRASLRIYICPYPASYKRARVKPRTRVRTPLGSCFPSRKNNRCSIPRPPRLPWQACLDMTSHRIEIMLQNRLGKGLNHDIPSHPIPLLTTRYHRGDRRLESRGARTAVQFPEASGNHGRRVGNTLKRSWAEAASPGSPARERSRSRRHALRHRRDKSLAARANGSPGG